MATTNFKGQPVKLIGEFIQVGKVAPDFELVKTDLSSFSLPSWCHSVISLSALILWHHTSGTSSSCFSGLLH